MDSWFFPFPFPRYVDSAIRGSGRDEEPSGAKCPPPDSGSFSDAESGENYASLSSQFAAAVGNQAIAHGVHYPVNKPVQPVAKLLRAWLPPLIIKTRLNIPPYAFL